MWIDLFRRRGSHKPAEVYKAKVEPHEDGSLSVSVVELRPGGGDKLQRTLVDSDTVTSLDEAVSVISRASGVPINRVKEALS